MSENKTVSVGAAVLVAIGAAIAIVVFVWQRRKYAALKAKQELQEHEAKRLETRVELEKNEQARDVLTAKAKVARRTADEIKTKIVARKAERDEFIKSLDQVTSWDDLVIE